MNDKKIKPRLDSEISTKEKYNTLKGKKKLEFIFDYYKLPIFGTIAAIIIVCYIGYSMYTKQDTYCNLTYLSSNMDTSQLTELKDTLNENLLDDNKKTSIFIDSMTIDPNSNYGDDPTTTQCHDQIRDHEFVAVTSDVVECNVEISCSDKTYN